MSLSVKAILRVKDNEDLELRFKTEKLLNFLCFFKSFLFVVLLNHIMKQVSISELRLFGLQQSERPLSNTDQFLE